LWHPDIYLFENDVFSIRWYSLLFLSGFIIGRFIVVRSYKLEKGYDLTVDMQMIYMVLGTLIGSRMGHILFYEPEIVKRGYLELFFFWKSGLASHGAAIGILLGMATYCYRLKVKGLKFHLVDRLRRGYDFFQVMDRMIIAVAIGCALIRMGNFVNSEIIGIPTDSDYGVLFVKPVEDRIKGQLPFVDRVHFEETGVFYAPGQTVINTKIYFEHEPYKEQRIRNSIQKRLDYLLPRQGNDYSHVINPWGSKLIHEFKRSPTQFVLEFESVGVYRHPAQLYESITYFLLGIFMFLIWQKHRIRLRPGSLLGFFFITAFMGRFLLEYVKENQVKNEFITINSELAIGLNLGQALSIPFVVLGFYLLFRNVNENSFFRRVPQSNNELI
jgi:prolipoprotein diacylglyceryl transferase